MKSLLKITLALTLTIFGLSESYAQFGKQVKGSGNVTSKTVQTGDYNEIKVVGSMDVHLERGGEGNIVVKTDDNLHEYVIIEVKDGALTVKTKKNTNLKTKNGIHVTVPFQDISSVSLVGSGDIDTKDVIKSNTFAINLSGSGDIVLEVDAATLDTKLSGSGDMSISGKAENFEIKLSGSGDFEGGSLMSNNTEAYVSGSGDVTVTAKNSLKARVNGSGDIQYSGNPEKSDTKVSGSGSIKSI
jgi:hypothetical protein